MTGRAINVSKVRSLQRGLKLRDGEYSKDVSQASENTAEASVHVLRGPWPEESGLVVKENPSKVGSRQFRLSTSGAGPTPVMAGRVRDWKLSYRRRLIAADVSVVIISVTIALFGRFGFPDQTSDDRALASVPWFSITLVVVWLVTLAAQQCWDPDLAGNGAEQIQRVVVASAWVFGAIAGLALVLQLYPYIARGYLLIALPTGLLGLMLVRLSLHRGLMRRRQNGECGLEVVVLGMPQSIPALVDCFSRNQAAGYSIAGVCVPGFASDGAQPIGRKIMTATRPVPILGNEDDVERVLEATNAAALIVTSAEHLGHERMRKLTWRLGAMDIDMIVAPGMADISGPRLKVRPLDNLPLFHIAPAKHDNASLLQKRVFDLILGSIACLFLLPLIAIAALAIKLDDGGPVFFRQERVGLRGRTFRIIKFRTMVVGAENRQNEEREEHGKSDAVFFKSANDSRITRIGRILRSTSIDEIPQIFNVLAGTMSLVGPRPLVPGEGSSVMDYVERRSLIKPGVTGLWQVSGRSDVSGEERIRLDHSYVDNWSLAQDFVIILRTIRAVLARDGAY